MPGSGETHATQQNAAGAIQEQALLLDLELSPSGALLKIGAALFVDEFKSLRGLAEIEPRLLAVLHTAKRKTSSPRVRFYGTIPWIA